MHLGEISPVEAMSQVKKVSPFWKFLSFFRIGGCCYGYCDKLLISKLGFRFLRIPSSDLP